MASNGFFHTHTPWGAMMYRGTRGFILCALNSHVFVPWGQRWDEVMLSLSSQQSPPPSSSMSGWCWSSPLFSKHYITINNRLLTSALGALHGLRPLMGSTFLVRQSPAVSRTEWPIVSHKRGGPIAAWAMESFVLENLEKLGDSCLFGVLNAVHTQFSYKWKWTLNQTDQIIMFTFYIYCFITVLKIQ